MSVSINPQTIELAIELIQGAVEIGTQLAKVNGWIREAQADGRDDILPEQLAELRADRQALKAKLDQEIERLLARENQ